MYAAVGHERALGGHEGRVPCGGLPEGNALIIRLLLLLLLLWQLLFLVRVCVLCV